jgi:myo-inositol 2-dehydrogenase / D-chiro-inositol 1-dehydrogenase
MTTNDTNHNALYVPQTASRRDFLRTSSALGIGALASSSNFAWAAGSGEIKLGLIGCGGRGSGAADQALSSGNKNITLWAMGDAHKDRLDGSYSNLSNKHADQVKVDDSRKFVGLDAYEKVLAECDLVILATPPGFRPYHFEAAVNAGKNIFMEKPVATDAPGVRKVLEMAKVADQKGLKVVAGLQRRYQSCYREALKQVKENNIIGDIVSGQMYWDDAGVWVKDRLDGMTEMQYQLLNWYYFAWLCGDHIVEQHIHNLDVANWFIGSTPISAQGMGGRQNRTGKQFGEIFDHHFVEYTYANGVRINSQCRHQKNVYNAVREEFHGTKGILYLDNSGRCRAVDYKGNPIWSYDREQFKKDMNPYQVEHNELQDAIMNNKPINNAQYVAESTMTAIFGRLATYGGKEIQWDAALNSQIQLMPAKVTWDTVPPTKPDENGFYPIPTPGVTKVI